MVPMDRGTSHRVAERFRLGRVLKASASGTVYVATERDGGREVVVKIIGLTAPLPSDAVRTRFQRAVSLIGEIDHPAFPEILEVGWASDSEAYIIAGRVAGEPLSEAPSRDAPHALAALLAVGAALDRLHTAGSAHLNVSPDNVLFAPDGTVRLVGLGSGWIPGAVTRNEFVAPELASDQAPGQPWRADVFSFARTICGVLGLAAVPEGSERFIVELSGDLAGRVADARRLREVLERSLHRQPEERPSSLSEVLRLLGAAIGPELLARAQESAAPGEADSDGEPLDRTVKIDLETVARLRAERGAQTGDAGPSAAPPTAAATEATAVGGAETDTMARTTRLDAAKARAVAAAGAVPGELAEAGTGAPADPPPRPRKRSPDTSPIPLPPSLVQAPPARADDEAAAEPSTAAAPDAPPTAAPPEAPQPEGAPGPASALLRPAGSFIARPWAWIASLASLLGVAAIVWLATTPGHRPSDEAAVAPPPAAVDTDELLPVVQAEQQLIDRAEAALATGDVDAAEALLAGVDASRAATLAREDRERLLAVRTAIAERRRWDLVRALDAAWAAGDLAGIRRAVADLAGEEAGPAQSQELQRKLDQARRLAQLDGELAEATRRNRWGDALQASAAILQVLDNCGEAAGARARAAAALESEADELAASGSYDAALARLSTLRRWWPDREGLAARTARIEAGRQELRSLRERLAAAERAGREGAPDEGLDALAGLPARGAAGAEVRALKTRLQEQLDSLDQATPRVSPAPGSTMQYEKDQPAVVSLTVEDDYRVRSVALFARREGGSGYAQFIATEEQPRTWTVRIPAAFHQNGTLEFYAVADDPSGHRGELGNEAAPLELKRRRRGLFGR